ncbi:MAG TPA: phosphatase PAP2 family protein [Candidatus Binatia bacterium]|nr:phosphatase PAP2 family protein [Candidatus Binatia bacterium]
MQVLFHLIPHTQNTDDNFAFLIMNPLLSTWIPAAFFYILWTRNDEQRERRRNFLFKTVIAFGIALFVTLLLRPFVAWPAPALNNHFHPLFPQRLWGEGSWNCFPSHSTLTYFMIAAGFWPLSRWLSSALSAFVLLAVSLPRVYVGGHYPIDVLFSCALGIVTLIVVWRWPVPPRVTRWLNESGFHAATRDWLFFLWTFELGEGFRGAEFLFDAARQIVRGY